MLDRIDITEVGGYAQCLGTGLAQLLGGALAGLALAAGHDHVGTGGGKPMGHR